MKNIVSRDPVVIIGGGLAGLTAANLLARNGFTVLIFEASNKIGGCCATTTLDTYTFNDGAVYLAIISPLDHVFQKLGLNRAEVLPLRKITSGSSTTLPDGTVVNLGNELDVTVTGRTADKNRLKNELCRMMDKWQPVFRFATEELLLHPYSPWRMVRKGWRHLPSFTERWLQNSVALSAMMRCDQRYPGRCCTTVCLPSACRLRQSLA